MRLIGLILLFMMLQDNSAVAQRMGVDRMDWKIVGELPLTNGGAVGFAGPIAGNVGNFLVAGGGSNFPDGFPWEGGHKAYYDSLIVYTYENDTLIRKEHTTFPIPIAYPACISVKRGIIVAGGENADGASKRVFLITWNKRKNTAEVRELPELPIALTSAMITADKNRIYLAGGNSVDGTSNQFLMLDLKSLSVGWKNLAVLPQPTSNGVLVYADKEIYLFGGRKQNEGEPSDLYSSVYRFNLKHNSWKEVAALPTTLSAGIGVKAGKSRIILFGGDRGETFHRTEELIFSAQKERDPVKKDSLIQEKNQVQVSHPGFSRDILLFDIRENSFEKVGEIPFATPVTTVATKWDANTVFIVGGEVRAGVRTPNILEVKMN